MEREISIQNVSVSAGKKDILQKVNLDIYKHAVTAVIGMSGCGKTTLLRTLNRMHGPALHLSSGQILLGGCNIFGMPIGDVRKQIGLIQQQPTVFPFSVRKNMTYALNYHGITAKEEQEERLEEALRQVGLYEEVKNRLSEGAAALSGGQQQRLCIARALTLRPKVLLLDEPCSALDIKNTLIVERTLKKLKENCTIVIVTHNLSQAKRIADFAVYMEGGTVVETKESGQLFTQPVDKRTREYMSYIQ